MILIFTLLGLAVGWLVTIAGRYLFRLSSPEAAPVTLRSPALLHLLTRKAGQEHDFIDLGTELVTGALFALAYGLHGLSTQTLWLIGVYTFFALIMFMDCKYRIVLNILTYPALILALAVNIVVLEHPVLPILLGLAFAFGIFYLAATFMPGGLGGGDIKLAALIGAALGFPFVLGALIVSAIASALTIVFMVTVQHRTLKHSIPYAPFLCLGAVVIFTYSSTLILS